MSEPSQIKEEFKLIVTYCREEKSDDSPIIIQTTKEALDYLLYLAKKHEKTKEINRGVMRKKRESTRSRKTYTKELNLKVLQPVA